jgi:hypothetical protein
MSFRVYLALLVWLFCAASKSSAQPVHCPVQESRAMEVDGNAPVITLSLIRADGTRRATRFIFDSGGGAIILDQAVATDLGLKPIGKPIQEEGGRFTPVNPPEALFGSSPIALSTSKAFVHSGKQSFDTRERVEGLLPGKALEPYQVVLDYPNKTFTIAPAGCVLHRGIKVKSPFIPGSGHPQIDVEIADKQFSLLLDTGSRVTLARRDVLTALSAAHPKWPHASGASGSANMPGGSGDEFMLRVPELRWGSLQVRNVLLVSRPDTTYSADRFETPGPISGALGGNVLRNFRVEIDYPNGTTYLEQKASDSDSDMNSVGLVLDVDIAGRLKVISISSTAAEVTKANILPGDQILKIAGKRGTPWTITDASNALAGSVGDAKQLVIKRHGKMLRTFAVVVDLL